MLRGWGGGRRVSSPKTRAKRFVEACWTGDVEAFWANIDLTAYDEEFWPLAMKGAARLSAVSLEIQAEFMKAWIKYTVLVECCGDRRLVADALQVLMPPKYAGKPLRLFRGADLAEWVEGTYGYSWTTRLEIAKGFAKDGLGRYRQIGAVLTTIAPPEAIFRVLEGGEEAEVVVDPFGLGKVSVIERFQVPFPNLLEAS